MVLDDEPDWEVVATLVRDAYLHVVTKKLRAALASSNPDAHER